MMPTSRSDRAAERVSAGGSKSDEGTEVRTIGKVIVDGVDKGRQPCTEIRSSNLSKAYKHVSLTFLLLLLLLPACKPDCSATHQEVQDEISRGEQGLDPRRQFRHA